MEPPVQDQPPSHVWTQIRVVFNSNWDPIGVIDDTGWPEDEYDSYIGEIYRFLVRGESEEFIARHLCFIENKLMGMGDPGFESRLSVAKLLKSISLS
jgi:hypothetical protein